MTFDLPARWSRSHDRDSWVVDGEDGLLLERQSQKDSFYSHHLSGDGDYWKHQHAVHKVSNAPEAGGAAAPE